MSDERITRREFFKNAAVAGMTAATASVMANILTAAKAEAAPTLPTKWDKEADIVVVGSGAAGYAAALHAQEAGASVILIEKEEHIGGSSILSGGHVQFCATDVQEKAGIEDKPEWMYQDVMKATHHTAQPELLKAFVEHSRETVLWMQSIGLKFAPMEEVAKRISDPTHRVSRSHWPAPDPAYPGGFPGFGGVSEINLMDKVARQRGISILTEHKMTQIYREQPREGRVIGIEVENKGVKLNFRANKGVIIATGCFKGSPALRQQWDPRLTEEVQVSGFPYVNPVGDGLVAGVKVGGSITDTIFGHWRVRYGHDLYQSSKVEVVDGVPRAVASAITGLAVKDAQDYVLVSRDGKRFMNEATGGEAFYEALLSLEYKRAFAVLDADGLAREGWKFQEPAAKEGFYFSAPTLKELAELIKVPADVLADTIAKYNSFVDAGKDADYGKQPKYKIEKGPFYAVTVIPFIHTRFGGLRINAKAQVLDIENNVIPGLYAAGTSTGGCFGDIRPTAPTVVGMAPVAVAHVFGGIAGKNAAAEKPSAG